MSTSPLSLTEPIRYSKWLQVEKIESDSTFFNPGWFGSDEYSFINLKADSSLDESIKGKNTLGTIKISPSTYEI